MIRLLLDQGAPYRAARLLSDRGIDTLHVGDLGLSEALDETILERARELDRIVCTFDGDYHALMALSSAVSPSVIFLRIARLNYLKFADLIEGVCRQLSAELDAPVLVTVTARGVRLHGLPVLRPQSLPR